MTFIRNERGQIIGQKEGERPKASGMTGVRLYADQLAYLKHHGLSPTPVLREALDGWIQWHHENH